jgi:hypothetical protein
MIKRVHTEAQEPVGIVISAGGRGEVAPRFAAFVWGPAPDEDAQQTAPEAKAA